MDKASNNFFRAWRMIEHDDDYACVDVSIS